MSPEDLHQEWRQFRVLARDGVRTLLNAAMLARDADPAQFALWTTALVATPPSLYAFGQMFKYSVVRSAPPAVVAPIIMADRMFFVVYSLIAAALLAAATWDALYPDRDDQEILGALPVRPRTVSAARLAAALGVAAAFATAINLPGAMLFSFVSVSGRALGTLPLVLLSHLVAAVAGCVTVFTLLLVARAVVSLALGSAVTGRLATALQLVTVVALVEVFFYLPSLLPVLVRGMVERTSLAEWMPPVWFGALHNWIAGPSRDLFGDLAWRGLLACGGAIAAVVPLYLGPASLMARRTLEAQPGGRRVRIAGEFIRGVVSLAAGARGAASIAGFAITTLGRSRRHLLVVVSYAGVGVAIALVQVIASGLRGGVRTDTPTGPLVAAPLITLFFLTAGVRAAFSVPRELDANWIFRLLAPTPVQAARGTLAALLVVAVLPVVAAAATAAQIFGWGLDAVARVAGLNLIMGLLLLQAFLYGWALVPFACGRPSGAEAVRVRWLAAAGPLLLFTLAGSFLMLASLRSWQFAAGTAAALLAAALLVSLRRVARLRREHVPFDPVTGHIEVLNLSEALH